MTYTRCFLFKRFSLYKSLNDKIKYLIQYLTKYVPLKCEKYLAWFRNFFTIHKNKNKILKKGQICFKELFLYFLINLNKFTKKTIRTNIRQVQVINK